MNHTQIGCFFVGPIVFICCTRGKKDRLEDEILIYRIDCFWGEKKELKDDFFSLVKNQLHITKRRRIENIVWQS